MNDEQGAAAAAPIEGRAPLRDWIIGSRQAPLRAHLLPSLSVMVEIVQGIVQIRRMRLSDHLIVSQLLYPRPIPTVPDVLILEIARTHASADLPLGRFYPVIIEDEEDLSEMTHFLNAERDTLTAPSLLDHKPSSLSTDDILFCRMEPPHPAWPWLLLCHWPARFTDMVPSRSQDFARGAYTVELFDSAEELDAMQVRLIQSLGTGHSVSVSFVSNAPAGRA